MKDKTRWGVVFVYALAMAWVESAVVHYLRTHTDRIQPYQANPLPSAFNFGQVELVREAATLLMLVLVGWLAGKRSRSKFGYALLAFGIWDLGYYIFLHWMNGWPGSLAEWDILFLLPLPWWGPVWAPMAISALMVGLGTLLTQFPLPDILPPGERNTWILAGVGVCVALYTFMAEAIEVLPSGESAVRSMLPSSFQWPLFLAAFALMSAPFWAMAAQAGFGRTEARGRVK